MTLETGPVATLQGEMRPPSDKSLTHRAFMFAAIASGPSLVRNALESEDCAATLACLTQMGLGHSSVGAGEMRLEPASEWTAPPGPLDCGNSGTTIRLLSGLVASRPIRAELIGDESLSKRPMGRIAAPLRLMGAHIGGETPPIAIRGGELHGIDYESPVASAQIKSCVLLAGLRASGTTSVDEPHKSRDHTERMLGALGASIAVEGNKVTLASAAQIPGFEFSVPGDISSAAFFMVAAAALPEGRLTLRDVGVNPARTGVLDVLSQTGTFVEVGQERTELGEPVADIEVRCNMPLKPFDIDGELVPRLIDEIPILAVLATRCEGTTRIRGARELRVKETDRIEAIAKGLRAMGARVDTFDDGLDVHGPVKLRAADHDARGDHRMAMAFAVAGLIADGTTRVAGAEAILTSFPTFESEIWRLALV